MFKTPEAKFAIDAVREAAALARRVQAEMVTDALTKGDKSPVTVGDFAAQAVVGKRLAEASAAHGICGVLVGEESADDLRKVDAEKTLEQVTHFVRTIAPDATPEEVCDWIDVGAANPGDAYWTLDPIDGTKGFLRGDQYAVALALVENGRVTLGVLGCPCLEQPSSAAQGESGSLLIAKRGEGAFWQLLSMANDDWHPLRVADQTDPAGTRMLRSVEKGHTNLGAIDHLATAMGVAAEPVGMDSQAKYAVLAAGGGEMLVRLLSEDRPDYREKVWDQAAGSIVIEEAGGRVTDLDGKPLDFSQGRTLANNRGVVATNGALHEAALAALKSIGA
ncbi:Inositol-1-monophosphatase [Botrimarina colliarenosi]|uniref:3'(2'),5'-bisphosphate nucleotidase n=1 Tax=Botrimarina colliarenosi TaxID=2528001 RepID=A0A5C6A736_9BACT|nr:3'(2'),5'-bisphosphate nucleotidase [Botrimarina colliarenosi]TWT95246.1 Inositol-1-monophosphatase [Botrimarina colliarenosi]